MVGRRNRQIESNDREAKLIVKRSENEFSRQFLPREESESGLESNGGVIR